MRLRALLLVCVLGSLAHADPAEISINAQVPPGKKPTLTLKANEDIERVRLELVREEDQRSFSLEHGRIRAGMAATLPVGDGQGGRAHWHGTLAFTLGGGSRFSNQLTFETGVVGELKISYRRDRLDLSKHVFAFQLSRPAGRAEIHVFGEDGGELGHGQANYHHEPSGTWLEIAWTQAEPAPVLRLEVRAESADGLAARVSLRPWEVRIAHDEVVFETGKWEIRPSEQAKLDASFSRIIAAVEKVRRAEPNFPVKLFVAGHTDTVGSRDYNRNLSLERARAIAAYFRERGLPLPIAYAGFGEEVLKVQTPDDTDEQANRRADYIVGVDEPVVARGVAAQWKDLP